MGEIDRIEAVTSGSQRKFTRRVFNIGAVEKSFAVVAAFVAAPFILVDCGNTVEIVPAHDESYPLLPVGGNKLVDSLYQGGNTIEFFYDPNYQQTLTTGSLAVEVCANANGVLRIASFDNVTSLDSKLVDVVYPTESACLVKHPVFLDPKQAANLFVLIKEDGINEPESNLYQDFRAYHILWNKGKLAGGFIGNRSFNPELIGTPNSSQ